jgi:hypothetical protein
MQFSRNICANLCGGVQKRMLQIKRVFLCARVTDAFEEKQQHLKHLCWSVEDASQLLGTK